MTENEALEALRLEGGLQIDGKATRVAQFFEGLSVAEEALKEIQQYRAIGTVEECREADKKTKPKAILDRCMFWECPTCGNVEIQYSKYCSDCGQRLNHNTCADTSCLYYSPDEDCPARNGCGGYQSE